MLIENLEIPGDFFVCLFWVFFFVLEFELRALHLLGRHSTT
jgi:hypothetical protein